MAKPVVFVIGASGNIGSATVQALSVKYSGKVEIRAGVRNPDKAETLKVQQTMIILLLNIGLRMVTGYMAFTSGYCRNYCSES